MNIIGLGEDRDFLIRINLYELEKLLGTWYANKIPGTSKTVSDLRAGDSIDIKLMHSMTEKLEEVCNSLIKCQDNFKSSQETLLAFADLVLSNKGSNDE